MSMDANRLTSDHFAVMLGFEPQNPVDSSQIRLPIQFVTGQEIERNGRVKQHACLISSQIASKTYRRCPPLPRTLWKHSKTACGHSFAHIISPLPSPSFWNSRRPLNNFIRLSDLSLQNTPSTMPTSRFSTRFNTSPTFTNTSAPLRTLHNPANVSPQILAERIAERVVRWDAALKNSRDPDMQDFYLSAAGCSLQLLNTLCVQLIRTPDRATIIDGQTQQVLLPVLMQWAARYRGRELLGDVSARMVAWLSGSSQFNRAANRVRRATKNWDTCGLPACSKKEELKACVRCQTVRYCSVEHQKQDWNGAAGSRHKLCCFQTGY
ncbi:MYND-type domain-containing protein [Mycena kentingensis (nom. inval.)]|nr:MYND-type domain-containing protein [Mycena kentingensis (nom. inval.)]